MYLLLHFNLSAAISLPTGATNMPPSFMQPHGWVNTGTAGGSGIEKVVGALPH